MLVSFREPIGAVTILKMKPLGRKTNSLVRTVRAAGLREKTTRKKRLIDRARTFRKSGLDVQKNMRHPAAGAFFYLTSPFIGRCYIAIAYRFLISCGAQADRWPLDASYHPHALPRRVPVTVAPGSSGLFEYLVYCGKFMRRTRARKRGSERKGSQPG